MKSKQKQVLANLPIEELNTLAAYKNREPITSPEQMGTVLITEPMDQEWKDSLKQDKFWSLNYEGDTSGYKDLLEFRDKILTFGGEEVCMPPIEEDLDKLMTRGQFWYGDTISMMEGEPSRCHSNTSYLWEANKEKVLIATGYALSSDGMWRQHSWGVMPKMNNSVIVETTKKRIAYYGFVMDFEESQEFLDYN